MNLNTFLCCIVTFGNLVLGQELECPNGWTYFSESCYFLAEEVNVDWIEATHFCALHHGHLAKIETAEEDTFLQAQCRRLFNTNATEWSDTFWLGATDDITEGIWLWYIDDTELTYENWNDGQPDSASGNQDCLSLHSSQNFKWHDYQCEAKYHPLCEINLGEEGTIIGK